MKPNAILVFATRFTPPGGIESHLKEFCGHVFHAGIIIDLVILDSKMSAHDEMYFKQVCRSVRLGKQGGSILRLIWLLGVCLRSLRREYKALYTNGQGESIFLVSRLFGRFSIWVHHHHTTGDRKDQLTWGKNYQKTLNKANKIIACSNRNAQVIESYLNRTITAVPCFSRKIMIQKNAMSNSSRLRFGYFGRLTFEKGIETLCRLSNESTFKDIEIHIWGEGNRYPRGYFENYPFVYYHGSFDSYQQLETIVQSLDAFLLLSNSPEGLPICLLEVMSAGVPWLAMDKGGIPDITVDDVSTRTISCSSDYNEIKNQIRLFADDIRMGKTSAKKQVEFYESKFSPTALIHQWVKILGLTVNNPNETSLT